MALYLVAKLREIHREKDVLRKNISILHFLSFQFERNQCSQFYTRQYFK